MRTTDDRASSKRLRVLVQQANREGIGISFATGRHLRECMKLAALLNVSGPGIFDGGRTLADTSTGRVLAVENLDPTAVRHIRDILKPSVYGVSHTWDGQGVKGWPMGNIVERVTTLRFSTAAKAVPIPQGVQEKLGIELERLPVAVSGGQGWLVRTAEVDKARFLHMFFDSYNVSSARSVGAGDTAQDLPILSATGYAIVVGDDQELATIADVIIARPDGMATPDPVIRHGMALLGREFGRESDVQPASTAA